MQYDFQHTEHHHHPPTPSHIILPARKDQSSAHTDHKCSSAENECGQHSIEPHCWRQLSRIDAAHCECAPWRPKCKEKLEDRRKRHCDAVCDGSDCDSHRRTMFYSRALRTRPLMRVVTGSPLRAATAAASRLGGWTADDATPLQAGYKAAVPHE